VFIIVLDVCAKKHEAYLECQEGSKGGNNESSNFITIIIGFFLEFFKLHPNLGGFMYFEAS
jgi:hypothetical protein